VASTTAEVDFPAPPFGLAKTMTGMRPSHVKVARPYQLIAELSDGQPKAFWYREATRIQKAFQ
jgi:hypothetical protein